MIRTLHLAIAHCLSWIGLCLKPSIALRWIEWIRQSQLAINILIDVLGEVEGGEAAADAVRHVLCTDYTKVRLQR